jgi:hypothetical protein
VFALSSVCSDESFSPIIDHHASKFGLSRQLWVTGIEQSHRQQSARWSQSFFPEAGFQN